jgi:general secretion pathway protein F
MAAFDYVALDGRGKQTKGVLEGDSQRQVRQHLRDKGLVPLSVEMAAKAAGHASVKKIQFWIWSGDQCT